MTITAGAVKSPRYTTKNHIGGCKNGKEQIFQNNHKWEL